MNAQGINIVEQALGAPPISLSNFSIVGVVGTAPGAAEDGAFGDGTEVQYDTPFYLTKRGDASPADLGTTGTLPLALDSIYAQGAVGVVMIIVKAFEDGGVLNLTGYDYILSATTFTSASKEFKIHDNASGQLVIDFNVAGDVPAELNRNAALRALREGQKITIGTGPTAPVYEVLATPQITDGDTDPAEVFVKLASGTALTTAQSVPTISAPKQDGTSLTRVKVAGVAADNTGVFALQTAQSILGVKPRLLVTPGFNYETGKQNIGSNLKLIASHLRAIAIIDVPNARADATSATTNLSSERTLLVSPQAKIAVGSTTQNFSMSGFVAGRIAVTDATQGFWTPVGNKQLEGVLGLAVPVDFEMGNANSGAQTRINAGTMTVVNYGGFRTWGDVSSDLTSAYKFVSVRRIADVLADSVQQNHLWAVSKAIGKNYLSEVSEGVNAFIRSLKAKGALVGGLCYPDGEKNTPDSIAKGEAYFNIEFTPVYPASSITFSVQLTKKYLAELG